MFEFVTLYYKVDDDMLLEQFFSETHLPLAEQLPGLIKSRVARVTGKPGGESRFHMAYTLCFEDDVAFGLALMSETGQALMQALKPWADEKLITWYYADAFEESRPSNHALDNQ